MKLITAIVHKRDEQRVCDALLQAGQQFTVSASTGGFLKDGNTTLLIGTGKDKVAEGLDRINNCGSTRDQFVAQPPQDVAGMGAPMMNPVKVNVGGAVVFVIDVERFEKM